MRAATYDIQQEKKYQYFFFILSFVAENKWLFFVWTYKFVCSVKWRNKILSIFFPKISISLFFIYFANSGRYVVWVVIFLVSVVCRIFDSAFAKFYLFYIQCFTSTGRSVWVWWISNINLSVLSYSPKIFHVLGTSVGMLMVFESSSSISSSPVNESQVGGT